MKPTICVKYKSGTSARALKVVCALSPVWAIWAPGVLLWLLLSALSGHYILDGPLISLAIIAIGLIAISVLSLFVCVRNQLQINDAGINFPLRFLLELKSKLSRPWSHLVGVEFLDSRAGNVISEHPDTMQMLFADGSKVPLKLAEFNDDDLKNYMLAMQSYAPDLPSSPPLPSVNLSVSARNAAESAMSFTQIWEEDMASRFGSTVFIPLEPGKKLQDGRLEVVGQIAFGGLSAIYLAKTTADNKLCVIKEAVIPRSSQKEDKDKALELFQREFALLSNLDHPRIASVLDTFVENDHNFIVLEYVDGKDLRKYVIEKGPQSELVVLRWATEIAEILSYLHGLTPAAVVHRDLTPDNLVLKADGSVYLIDFGAANEFIGVATGTVVGKQCYISPEQFRGKASPLSDLYSLGATLYFLLTGKDPEALSTCHVRDHNSEISESVDELVAALMALEVSERIQSAEELSTCCRVMIDQKRKAKMGAAV